MRTSLPLLDDIRVASPCNVDWNAMHGDDQTRFCGQCEKNVYNLSAMTRAEASQLVKEKEGRMCVRFFQRPDGTMLTADCPVGVQKVVRRRRGRLASMLASMAGFFMLSGCAREEDPTGPQTPDNTVLLDPFGKPVEKPCIMGEMAPIQGGIAPPGFVELKGDIAVPPPPAIPAPPALRPAEDAAN